jgi:2,4-didehydro-3-deoxy-L-rhamnonate hydrolase
MRIANLDGRAVLITSDGRRALDINHAADGRFGPDLKSVYDEWSDFCTWARTADLSAAEAFHPEALGAPSPTPRQIFAVGLNYRDHAAEASAAVPVEPTVLFTKWASCLSGPVSTVSLPAAGHTDWEVELVAVIGSRMRRVDPDEAWAHVAGVTVGQDLSERISQNMGQMPQFSLSKSLPGFGPTGPWLVTPDELADPDDLELGCHLNGEQVQRSRTSDMVFSVPVLIAWLSNHVTLLPGDLVFTGTPAGVGLGRTPPRYLQAGDQLVSYITGLGELRQSFSAAS